MSDEQFKWLTRAAEIAETLTDDEIMALGRRLRKPAAEWLRQAAVVHRDGDEVNEGNVRATEWVMRLLLEQRAHTFMTNENLRLGPRTQE